jgi:carbon-monoxide dehydrogenase large subunit
MTTQAPHAIRTVIALITGHLGLSEEKIRIVSPDIGGVFMARCRVSATSSPWPPRLWSGAPVKWIED